MKLLKALLKNLMSSEDNIALLKVEKKEEEILIGLIFIIFGLAILFYIFCFL